jgi:predicted nucleic acid-binding protein
LARLTLDANVLVYAADRQDPRAPAAQEIIARAAQTDCILTVQALGEFLTVVLRKKVVPQEDASRLLTRWVTVFGQPAPHDGSGLALALEAAALGRFQFWDAMLLATAGAAGCTALISEDMAPGARLGEVTVVRAFDGAAVSPEAAAVLA